jgi:CBS-domain-containing membrane protein
MNFMTVQIGARDQSMKLAVCLEVHIMNARQFIHPPKSRIVACV